jgi:hypothetical protein
VIARRDFICSTSFRPLSPEPPERRLTGPELPSRFCRRRGEPPIRTITIEAPTTTAATALVSDLVPFARTDLVPLEGERWEVRVEESSDEELDAVLHAVARWATGMSVERPRVLVDDAPFELPA